MSHFTTLIVIVVAIVSFLLGRASAKVLRNRYLEAKRDELMAIKSRLVEIEEGLERREGALRSKWQAMVVNASEMSVLVNGGGSTWTPEDDRFLESWSSAERATKIEE